MAYEESGPETLPKTERILNEFLQRYLADSGQGTVQSVGDYQRRFPGAEEAIAAEFARLQDDTAEVTETIGPYRVIGEIGRGGQGVVFLAEDRRLGRQVAIKLLTGLSVLSEDHRKRFLREAQVASRLDHPGICAVFDTGDHEGTPYIVMRYLAGQTLAARILEASDPPTSGEVGAAVAIIEQAARALHTAHAAGVIHRDVKPGNIMLVEDAQPVVLDFGLARAADDETLTRSGDFFGTPAYMAPEQLRGERQLADPRTDVYALGVTLYELLTLQRPFDAPTRDGLYRAILTEDPPDPRSINARIGRDLKVVLDTAMEKDLDRRYQSAEHLADDLACLRRDEPIHAVPISITGRALRWVRRSPARAVAVATVVAAGLVISALAGYLWSKQTEIARGQAQLALESFEDHLNEGFEQIGEGNPQTGLAAFEQALRMQPDNVEAIAGLVLARVRCRDARGALAALDLGSGLPAAERRALSWVRVYALRQAGSPEADRLEDSLPPPDRPIELFLAGMVQLAHGDRTQDRQSFTGAVSLLSRAVRQSRTARLLYHVQCAHAASHAFHQLEIQRSAETLPALWPDSARAWFHVGFALSGVDQERAADAYRHAIAIRPNHAVTHLNLGLLLEKAGDLDGAIAAYEKAARHDPGLAKSYYNIANVRAAQGKRDEALRLWLKAIEVEPFFAEAHNNAGHAFLGRAEPDAALEHLEAAVGAKPDYPEAWNNLGAARAQKSDLDGAIVALEKAVALRPDYTSALGNLGALHFYQKNYQRAAECVAMALEGNDKSAPMWNTLGAIKVAMGEPAAGIAAYEKALDLNPKMPAVHANLGEIHLQQGNDDKAWECVEAALALDAGQPSALGTAARIFFKRGETERAIKAVESALPRAGEVPGLAEGLEKNLEIYRKALKDAPNRRRQ